MSRVREAVRAHGVPTAGASALLLLALVAWAVPGASGAFSARITNSTDTAATAAYFTCTAALAGDKGSALFQWPLNDTAGTGAADISGNVRNGTHIGGTTTDASTPIACPRDPGTSWVLDGSTQYAYSSAQQLVAPNTFTMEVWFRTSAAQGRLMGFGSSTTGLSTYYDRHLYINGNGFLVFGVFPNAFKTVTSPTTVTDNTWHYAAATLSSAGMVLYLDGKQVGADAATTSGQGYPLLSGGYWRVGYDNLATWPGATSSAFFKGRMRFAAVYTSALSATQIAQHWVSGS